MTKISILMLYLALAFLPFSTSIASGGVFTFGFPLFGLSVTLLLLSREYIRSVSLYESVLLVWMVVLGISTLIFSAYSENPSASIWRAASQCLGCLFAGFILIRRPQNIDKHLSWSLCLGSTLMAAYFVVNFILAVQAHGLGVALVERTVGGATSLPWGASNVIASTLLIGLATCLISYQKWPMRLYIFVSGLLILAILLTFSRNASLIALLIMLMFLVRSKSKLTIMLLIAISIMGIEGFKYAQGVAGNFLNILVRDRTSQISLGELNGRSEIWRQFADYFYAYPFEPLGYYGSMSHFGHTGHSIFYTTLVEQGGIGMILQFGFLILILILPLISRNKLSMGEFYTMSISIFLIIVSLMFEDPYFTQQYTIMFWLFISLLIAMSRGWRENEKEKTRIIESQQEDLIG